MEATTDAVAQAEAAVELGIETLRGDIRDRILDNICRPMPCWTKMSEQEQKRFIGRAETIAYETVREAAQIIAHQGFAHLIVSTGKWTVKDGIKLEVGASSSVDDITKLASHGAGSAVLVLAEPSVFFGQRADAVADKDQPDLPIDEGDEAEDGDEDGEEAADRSPLPEPPARETRSRRTREPADA
ncbi:MAG: hypothetical protein K2X54_02160 [Methylobacterium organophilum]|nr:hypothetical protein [Methylobacterium organophilum]